MEVREGTKSRSSLFLSCRSPNFTYRQGFQAKPSSRGPPPRRVPWSQEDAPPLRSLPGAKGLTMLSVTPSLRATKSVITDTQLRGKQGHRVMQAWSRLVP